MLLSYPALSRSVSSCKPLAQFVPHSLHATLLSSATHAHLHLTHTHPSALIACGLGSDAAGDEGALPEAVAQLLRPAAVAAYQAALAAAFTASAEERRRTKDAGARVLDDAFCRLQLYGRGAESLQVRVCVAILCLALLTL